MLKLDAAQGGLPQEAFNAMSTKLAAYREHLAEIAHTAITDNSEPACSIALPQFATAVANGTRVANLLNPAQLAYVVVIGIGGSNLGTMAVYHALFGKDDALRARKPKMLFLDTVSVSALAAVQSALLRCGSSQAFTIFIISKSGTTTESVANAATLIDALTPRFPDVLTRCIAITDEGSTLWKRAVAENVSAVAIPRSVGGRFSVFTAVGLLPLSAVGIDVHDLLRGARSAVHDCTAAGATNPALVSAAHTFFSVQHGCVMHNSFFFDPDLEDFGKWYRQLMAESLGKSEDIALTPTVNVGSTDLHSMAQRYLGGAHNMFTNFVTRPQQKEDRTIPAHPLFEGLVADLEKQTMDSVMTAISEGVGIAYAKQQLPYLHMHMLDRSPASIGYFLQMRMIEVMYLGQLFDVNAFDQPAVELYKNATRALLAKEQRTDD